MLTFAIAFAVIALAMLGMAVGVLLANKKIRGSCGGLSEISGLESACDMCSKPCARRRAALDASGSQPLRRH